MTFKFNKKRIKRLSNLNDIKENCNGILYWMFRDIRIQGNYMLYINSIFSIKKNSKYF